MKKDFEIAKKIDKGVILNNDEQNYVNSVINQFLNQCTII